MKFILLVLMSLEYLLLMAQITTVKRAGARLDWTVNMKTRDRNICNQDWVLIRHLCLFCLFLSFKKRDPALVKWKKKKNRVLNLTVEKEIYKRQNEKKKWKPVQIMNNFHWSGNYLWFISTMSNFVFWLIKHYIW